MLLKILLQINKNIFTLLFVLFFSVQYASMEMVVWHHIAGYILFTIFLLGAIYHLQKYNTDKSAIRQFYLVACLVLATFTYELGFLVSIVVVLYMMLCNLEVWRNSNPQFTRRSFQRLLFDRSNKYSAKLIVSVLAISISYIIIDMTDFFIRFGNFPSEANQVINSIDVWTTICNIASVSLLWFFGGFLPLLLNLHEGGERLIFDLSYINTSLPSLMGILLFIIIFVSCIIVVTKTLTRAHIKKHIELIFVVSLSMLLYVAMHIMYRANLRGFFLTITTNTYYTYMFSLLAFILLYTCIDFDKLSQLQDKTLAAAKKIFLVCIIFIIGINAMLVFNMNVQMYEYSKPRLAFIYEINDLIIEHSGEADLSFSVAERCIYNQDRMWGKRGDPANRTYTPAEIFFPQYYVKNNGKYQVSC